MQENIARVCFEVHNNTSCIFWDNYSVVTSLKNQWNCPKCCVRVKKWVLHAEISFTFLSTPVPTQGQSIHSWEIHFYDRQNVIGWCHTFKMAYLLKIWEYLYLYFYEFWKVTLNLSLVVGEVNIFNGKWYLGVMQRFAVWSSVIFSISG